MNDENDDDEMMKRKTFRRSANQQHCDFEQISQAVMKNGFQQCLANFA